jgi:DNA invertase Pin-like site-specific DNA recombinase
MRVAYVRESTADQSCERQLEALERFNIEKIYKEKPDIKDTDREQFEQMLESVKEGDEVYVVDLSTFSRNLTALCGTVARLNQKKIRIVSIKEDIDTGTEAGRITMTVICAIARFEMIRLLERKRIHKKEEARTAHMGKTNKGRRKLKLDNFEDVYQSWINNEITAVAAAELLGITRATFYNRVKTASTEW